jgi:uncharacterized membrane protein YgaE (UPF0421/DUF939 family)
LGKLFKALLYGLSFILLYALLLIVGPLILLLAGHNHLASEPALFGHSLYKVNIHDHAFKSAATILGVFLSFVLGIVFFALIRLIASFFKKPSNKMVS